jgi:hypothetical protein
VSVAMRGARYLAREAVDSAAFHAVSPAAEVAGRGADLADRLFRAHRHIDRGASALANLHARGHLGGTPAATHVGGEWVHGGSDRANALAQIGIDAASLEHELAGVTSEADRAWVAASAAPVFSAWKEFVARLAASPVAPYTTEWSVYTSWRDRFVMLRNLARMRGIVLTSPDPPPLPKTIFERANSGEGSQLDGYLTLAKTAILGAITLTGVIGFYSIVRDLRRHHE